MLMTTPLIKKIEENRDYRARAKRREADRAERMKTIEEAARRMMLEMWCKACSKDVRVVAVKRVGYNGSEIVAWYNGRCACGAGLRRHITDKSKDSFFRRSHNIKFQRVRSHNDMLTPADDLFKVIYPKEYDRLNHPKN